MGKRRGENAGGGPPDTSQSIGVYGNALVRGGGQRG